MPDRRMIGKRLRSLRGDKTQHEVSKALGCTAIAVSMWERGERVPTDDMKIKIAKYFGVTVSSIFFE